MEETILITGKYSAISDDLVQDSLNRGARVFATHDGAEEKPEVPDTIGDALSYVVWSRRSLLSARSMILTVDRESQGFRRVVVVCSPEGVHSPLHETPSALIEERIDLSLKGYLFVIKEISAYLLKNGGGELSILWYDGGADILAPLDAAIVGALRELTRSLFAFYEGESLVIRGFEASDGESRAVAHWVLDSTFEGSPKTAGRWAKYGRTGLLPFRH